MVGVIFMQTDSEDAAYIPLASNSQASSDSNKKPWGQFTTFKHLRT
jgi:hypothetical protein